MQTYFLAVKHRNYEHMQKQERTNYILITDYVVVVNVCFFFVYDLFGFLCILYLAYYNKPLI